MLTSVKAATPRSVATRIFGTSALLVVILLAVAATVRPDMMSGLMAAMQFPVR